jgi:hypothetical protein
MVRSAPLRSSRPLRRHPSLPSVTSPAGRDWISSTSTEPATSGSSRDHRGGRPLPRLRQRRMARRVSRRRRLVRRSGRRAARAPPPVPKPPQRNVRGRDDASNIRQRDYGMGACAGDVDNDGLIDLYITNVGPNALYRNAGGWTVRRGARGRRRRLRARSTSCAFVDVDRDGDLDLFVTNYVDASHAKNRFCGFAGPPAIRDYCHPLVYAPLPNVLYRNDGSGRFEDVSTQAGIAPYRGNGLGVAVSDVDDDGWPDIFVANDSTPNFLFHNNRTDPSRRSPAWPAWPWRRTARPGPAWEPRSAISAAPGTWDSSSRTTKPRCTACSRTSAGGCSPTSRSAAASDPRRARTSASASSSSTTTTIPGSTSRSSTGT